MSLPTEYYSHAGITIYHGDCREILPLEAVPPQPTQAELPE